ncbi:hypothetical protein KIPB_012908 [Kipferlia bialata]|uniref:non-specific serine/threonine protein kinase n=1 Tax=Kipferlia bialata TaxID=797122 RepID=A0A9K3DA53_9EUKA|nr:hypothetical protein KIPB_012908 [Kipferlia bialata]|eukprot:g12908.t1
MPRTPKADEPQVDKVSLVKGQIERYFANIHTFKHERLLRRNELERRLDALGVPESERDWYYEQLNEKETLYTRKRRQRLTPEHFETISVIGRGAFGEVCVAREKSTGQIFAMKKLRKKDMIKRGQTNHVRTERDIMARGDASRWLVRLFYSFQDATHLYLLMEYLPGGDMMTLLIRCDVLSEDTTRFYMAEAVLAIEAVHKLQFMHRYGGYLSIYVI